MTYSVILVSGVASMYACMLEHPHHFDKEKRKKKKMTKERERERERERDWKIMERLYDSPLG